MYKKIIFILIQILCLQCVLPSSGALAEDLSRTMGMQKTNAFTPHSVTVNGTTYNFLIHYNNSSDDPENPHLCTATYRDKIKEYLTETLQIFLNPTFASDGIPFKGPVLDGNIDIDDDTQYNNIDIYIINIKAATGDNTNTTIAFAIPDQPNMGVASGCMIINNTASYAVENYEQTYVEMLAPPTNALRTTIMHEFFHLIQNAYHYTNSTPKPTSSLLEGTAVWAETCANITYNFKGNSITTEDKGYYKYLYGGMFQKTNLGLFPDMVWAYNINSNKYEFRYITQTGHFNYPYSSVVFWKYLTERFFDEQQDNTDEQYNAQHNFKPIRKIFDTYGQSEYKDNEIQAYNNTDPNINLPSVIKDFYTTLALMPVMHFGDNYKNIKNNSVIYTVYPVPNLPPPSTTNFVYKQKGNGRKKDDYTPKGFMTLIENGLLEISQVSTLAPTSVLQTYSCEGYGDTYDNFRCKLYATGTNFHSLKTAGAPDQPSGFSPCLGVTLNPSCLGQTINNPNGYGPTYTEECPTIDNRPVEGNKLNIFSIQIEQDINTQEIKVLNIIEGAQPQNTNQYNIRLQKDCFSKTILAVHRSKFKLDYRLIDYDLTLNFGINHCRGHLPCSSLSIPHKKDDGEYEEYDILSTFAEPQTVITRSALYNIQGQLLKSWAYDINPQDIYNNYNFPLSLGFLIKENSRGERISQLKMMLK